jgi:carboxyl-terminal processing protease
MLAGLRPFLGDGTLGFYVVGSSGDKAWNAHDRIDVRPPSSLAALESAYVAVIVGPGTASSGESVAISFIGRQRTKLFGLPTAGVPTSPSAFPLPDGSQMMVVVALEADRNGTRYTSRIQPDEIVPPGPSSSVEDVQLARAIEWLRSQTCQ